MENSCGQARPVSDPQASQTGLAQLTQLRQASAARQTRRSGHARRVSRQTRSGPSCGGAGAIGPEHAADLRPRTDSRRDRCSRRARLHRTGDSLARRAKLATGPHDRLRLRLPRPYCPRGSGRGRGRSRDVWPRARKSGGSERCPRPPPTTAPRRRRRPDHGRGVVPRPGIRGRGPPAPHRWRRRGRSVYRARGRRLRRAVQRVRLRPVRPRPRADARGRTGFDRHRGAVLRPDAVARRHGAFGRPAAHGRLSGLQRRVAGRGRRAGVDARSTWATKSSPFRKAV